MKVSSRLSQKRKKTKVLMQIKARAQAPSEGACLVRAGVEAEVFRRGGEPRRIRSNR